eukprot:1071431-Ditylum_brightwellii.AAC.1
MEFTPPTGNIDLELTKPSNSQSCINPSSTAPRVNDMPEPRVAKHTQPRVAEEFEPTVTMSSTPFNKANKAQQLQHLHKYPTHHKQQPHVIKPDTPVAPGAPDPVTPITKSPKHWSP